VGSRACVCERARHLRNAEKLSTGNYFIFMNQLVCVVKILNFGWKIFVVVFGQCKWIIR
jgi:hypothetical protein